MRIHNIAPLVMAFSLLMPTSLQATPSPETELLYQQHCASCHGQDRLGGMGPALLPDNLSRLKKPQAEDAIRNGRPATQMPAFADVLGKESITRVKGVGTCSLTGGQDLFYIQISFCGGCTLQCNGLIRFTHKWRSRIGLRINGDRGNAHGMGGANDSASDFSAVGNQ